MGERQKGKLTTGLEYFYWKSFCHLRLSDVVHLSGERRGGKKPQWEQEESFNISLLGILIMLVFSAFVKT